MDGARLAVPADDGGKGIGARPGDQRVAADKGGESLRRPDLGRPFRGAISGKALAIDLAAAGIEDGEDRSGADVEPGILGVNGERADADHLGPGDQGKPAGRGNPDPEAGEGTGADGDGDAVKVGEGEPGLGHRRLDDAHEALGVAARDDLGTDDRLAVSDGNADRAGFQRGVDGEQAHEAGDSARRRPGRDDWEIVLKRLAGSRALREQNGEAGSRCRASRSRSTTGSRRRSRAC
jgi:hypothetical protein